ncbi:MAG: alpha/beta hydrolase [Opitutales bacterium]|jgi:acetyl esterase/lipase|nr:alpha/beta hydrolase [Opitutales bacterium]
MKYFTSSFILFLLTSASVLSVADPITWNLWPGEAPGEIVTLPPESYRVNDDRLTAGKPVRRLQNVSIPTLTIYKPDPKIDTGSSIMIAPGGGFTILAYDKEGTEVAEWANSIGMTAIVLKYRVPGNVHNPEKPWLPAAQDGQRAMSLVRSRSDELGIDPDRIGIMGFSAGGAPVNYTAFASERLYEAVDRHDDHSFRPAFAAPIYSGVWMPEGMDQSDAFPPVFIVITYDDKDRSIGLAEAYIKLKKANVSAEMHIYSEGGHGYGLRRTEKPVTSWPDRMEDWLKLKGFLDR